MTKAYMAYLGLLWVAALLFVHVEGRVMASQQQGTKEPPLPLPILNSDKDCGVPYALCGGSIPDGIKCPNGQGWCQKSYFCGWVKVPLQEAGKDKAGTLRCLPVPENCGTVGNECCPSNAVAPHTQRSDVLGRLPYCTDGSVCFSWGQHHMHDFYQGNEGDWACMQVPQDCGTAGKSCCLTHQGTWRMGSNPPVKSRDTACDGDLVCKGADRTTDKDFKTIVKLGTCG
jgi:hypothetical protein